MPLVAHGFDRGGDGGFVVVMLLYNMFCSCPCLLPVANYCPMAYFFPREGVCTAYSFFISSCCNVLTSCPVEVDVWFLLGCSCVPLHAISRHVSWRASIRWKSAQDFCHAAVVRLGLPWTNHSRANRAKVAWKLFLPPSQQAHVLLYIMRSTTSIYLQAIGHTNSYVRTGVVHAL